jgi:hypothetical protein
MQGKKAERLPVHRAKALSIEAREGRVVPSSFCGKMVNI